MPIPKFNSELERLQWESEKTWERIKEHYSYGEPLCVSNGYNWCGSDCGPLIYCDCEDCEDDKAYAWQLARQRWELKNG